MEVVHSGHQQAGYQFDLSGGALCLDFANTVSHRHLPQRRAEHLDTYADLVAFADQSKLLPPKLAASLRAHASRDPAGARSAFRKSVVLRESLYRAFSATAAGKHVPPADVRQINDFALVALQHRKLARTNGDYRWEWQCRGSDLLDRMLWPVAESAAELLTSDARAAIRECRAPDCGWLFLDHSRNRSRRWCDMKSCGNRQKARRHYQRAHA
jgi:predicted RNA-binding Zn ribbon-like protein